MGSNSFGGALLPVWTLPGVQGLLLMALLVGCGLVAGLQVLQFDDAVRISRLQKPRALQR